MFHYNVWDFTVCKTSESLDLKLPDVYCEAKLVIISALYLICHNSMNP